MKNLILKFINSSFYKALHRVLILPKLPIKINNFYNHFIVRVLRVIGGICFIIMISNKHVDFPFYLKNLIEILAFIQILQMICINLIKFFFGIYLLKKNPELFEIRNSPLDKTASAKAKLLWCGWLGTCGTLSVGTAAEGFTKKLPNWIKSSISLLLFILIVIKLLGFGFIDIFTSIYYFKIYLYVTCSIAILYQLINLYLIQLFSNKNIKIWEVLPDFIIKWLKEFEEISSDKESINYFKKSYYLHLCIYTVLLILILFI